MLWEMSHWSHSVIMSPRYNRSAGYIQKRHTSNLKVLFYVGDRFNEEYSGKNLRNVEKSVEEDYISNLRNNCWKEKQQSKSGCTQQMFNL